MKKLIIGFVLLILVLGGAIGTIKFLKIGPFEEQAAENVQEEVEEEEPTFVTMEPLILNVFEGDQVVGNFQLGLQVEVIGDENASKVRKLERRLKDAFIRDLHAFLPRVLKQSEGLDLQVVQQRLRLVANQIAEPGLVRDVLIQSVINKPGR